MCTFQSTAERGYQLPDIGLHADLGMPVFVCTNTPEMPNCDRTKLFQRWNSLDPSQVGLWMVELACQRELIIDIPK